MLESQLEDLPGVGKATAGKIIAGRPFTSVDDLVKAGVSKSTIAKITPLVTVKASNKNPAVEQDDATTPARTPPKPGMVWVNTSTKVYHKEGAFYGTTKKGKFMTEEDAIKAGYRAAKPATSKKAATTKK